MHQWHYIDIRKPTRVDGDKNNRHLGIWHKGVQICIVKGVGVNFEKKTKLQSRLKCNLGQKWHHVH